MRSRVLAMIKFTKLLKCSKVHVYLTAPTFVYYNVFGICVCMSTLIMATLNDVTILYQWQELHQKTKNMCKYPNVLTKKYQRLLCSTIILMLLCDVICMLVLTSSEHVFFELHPCY